MKTYVPFCGKLMLSFILAVVGDDGLEVREGKKVGGEMAMAANSTQCVRSLGGGAADLCKPD